MVAQTVQPTATNNSRKLHYYKYYRITPARKQIVLSATKNEKHCGNDNRQTSYTQICFRFAIVSFLVNYCLLFHTNHVVHLHMHVCSHGTNLEWQKQIGMFGYEDIDSEFTIYAHEILKMKSQC